jgi:hypothetical protein
LPARRECQQRVVGAEVALREVASGGSSVVLCALDRAQQRPLASGDERLHALGIEPIGRRDLRGVESTEAATRAGTEVEPATAALQRGEQRGTGSLQLRERPEHGGRDRGVLLEDACEQGARWEQIEVEGSRVPRLCRRRTGRLFV